MPQLPDSLAPKGPPQEPEVEWQTISYRTVAMIVIVIALILGTVAYFVFPNSFGAWVDSVVKRKPPAVAEMQQKQARFLNLDGTVRVKKANSVAWTTASENTPLEKGDVVQTGTDGLARIIFTDGTNYTIRADTLIVVEENAANPQTKATNVAVTVTSGTVDLATTKFTGESKVTLADATASLREDSHAMVKNDPKSETREIMMTQGSADVMRGSERTELGQYEKVSLPKPGAAPGATMSRERFMGPPLLMSPANLAPLVVTDPKSYSVNFSWTEVPNATGYRLRVSSTAIFSRTVLDRTSKGNAYKAAGLPEGTYYWAVTTVGDKNKESENSDVSKFTIVKQQGGDKDEILLVVDDIQQLGKGFVVIGRTEPGARVLVNDEPVFNVNPDGSFKHYTQPFAKPGPNQITVTAQNSKGKIASRRKTILVE
jgi:hypothetical protein